MQEFVEVDPLNLEAFEEPAKNKNEIKIEIEKKLNATKPSPNIKDQLESNKSNLDFEHDCDLCSKKFATEENLRKHVKLRHHFQCRFCSRTFSEQKFLQKHVETMCTKLKNSVIGSCKICDESFASRESTIKHLESKEHKGKSNVYRVLNR